MFNKKVFIAAILVLACGTSFAADRLPLFDLGGGYSAKVDETGRVSVTKNAQPFITDLFLGIWTGEDFSGQQDAIKLQGAVQGTTVIRRGVIPRGRARIAYETYVRVTPLRADGFRDLIVTCIADSDIFPDGKAALILRLPASEFKGKIVSLQNSAPDIFGLDENKKLFLTQQNVHEFSAADGDTPVLFVARQDAGDILVQDAKEWLAGTYEAQFTLMPTKSQPASRRIVQLIISLSGKRGPTVAEITANRPWVKGKIPAVPLFGLYETRLDMWAAYTNPYDTKDIEVSATYKQPDGTERTVRGFYYQPYKRELSEGNEKLTVEGAPDWRIRFAPSQLGEHSYTVTIKTARGEVTTWQEKFVAVASDAPGFIAVHKNKRNFQFTNGSTYFAVGHNVCWAEVDRRTYEFEDYFRRMANAGENYTRVWMSSWDTGIESESFDNYRLDNAWRLDYVLSLAEQRGIYLKLCLDNTHDFINVDKRKLFPYWNNGPAEKEMDFFTIAEIQASYKRRLDYIVARWGYSPNVMAWELWNEISYMANDNPDARKIIVAWIAENAKYLRQIDPNKHMVTTSLGWKTVWDEVWELPEIDFAVIHSYLPQLDSANAGDDEVLYVLKASERIAKFGKPYQVSEFGHFDLNGVNRANELDHSGIALHNVLWGSLFTGAAGTPANWWWKKYIHDKNLYIHYASVAQFLKNIDLADADWRQIASSDADRRMLGIRKHDRFAVWIQQKGNNWHRRAIGEKPLEPLGTFKIRFSDVPEGEYRITLWDTYASEITNYTQKSEKSPTVEKQHDIVIEYKTGRPDMAIKIEKIK